MKRPIIFMQDKNGEVSGVKFILAVVNFVFIFISYFGGKSWPFGLLLFPVFIFFMFVSIWYLVKSIKNKTFELFSLYLLPFVIAGMIGIQIDSINTKKVKKNLLEAQSYVEKFIEENHSLPENNDVYLKELDVQIQGEKHFSNYLKAEEYFKEYYKKNGKRPDDDDPYLMELDANQFGEDFYYELHSYGARIKRGEKEVRLYSRP